LIERRRDPEGYGGSRPRSLLYAGKYFQGKIDIAPISGRKTLYAIGLAPNSPSRKPLNIAPLEFAESSEWIAILQQYLSH
jgi:hypothetical protein